MVLSIVYQEDQMPNTIEELRGEIQSKLDELMANVEPLKNALKALESNGSAPKDTTSAPVGEASEGAPEMPQTTRRRGRPGMVTDEMVIDVVKANPNCGAAKIREVIPVSSNAMSMRLTRLVKQGRLIRMGERRNTHYRVPANVPSSVA